jgi:hypothetical protein
MPAHRPFFVVRDLATGELGKVGYASVEDDMQQVLLTNGSTEAALDFLGLLLPFAAVPKTQSRKRRRRTGSG